MAAAEAKAEASKAAAERGRARRSRRITLASFAALLLLLAVGAGSRALLARAAAERREATTAAVGEALVEANRLRGEGALPEAHAAAERAVALALAEEVVPETRARAQELERVLRQEEATAVTEARTRERDVRMAERLKAIRYANLALGWNALAAVIAPDPDYEEAFREYGIDLGSGATEGAVERVRSSAIRDDLIDGLQGWLVARTQPLVGDADGGRALLALLDAADPEPERVRLHRALLERDRDVVVAIASALDLDEATPSHLARVAWVLCEVGEFQEAETLLAEAEVRHPGDLEIRMRRYPLQRAYEHAPEEVVRQAEAIVALSPESSDGHYLLGQALLALRDVDGAVEAFERGLRQAPQDWRLVDALVSLLRFEQRLEAWVEAWRERVRADEDDAGALVALGHGLFGLGKPERPSSSSNGRPPLDPRIPRSEPGLP